MKVYKKKIGLILVALTLITVSCKNKNNDTGKENEKAEIVTPVTVVEVKKSDFYEFGEYYGRVQGVNRSSIINLTGGTVESVDAVEGSDVSKGESLAKISSEKATLAFNSAKLNEKISRENYHTLKRFLANGNSSQIDVDKAHLTWLNSKTQLIDAEKAYEAAYCIAQIDGTVVSRNIDVEDKVQQGQETFLIEDLSEIEITIGIPESDMEGVTEGSSAEVYLDLYPERVWEGELTRLSRRSSDMNLTFSATIIVNNKDRKILSGTTAKVKLLRNSYENYIIIPSSTVLKEDGKNYVMVLAGDRVEKKMVEVAASSVDNFVIISGLNIGDLIVEEGLHILTDSQLVNVIDQGV